MQNQSKLFISVKKAADMFNISKSSLYEIIKTEPSFPAMNVGAKKKLVIDSSSAERWFKDRTRSGLHLIPSSTDFIEKYR